MTLDPLEQPSSSCHPELKMSRDEVTEKASLLSEGDLSEHTAIAILSANHTVLSSNHGMETLTGYTLEALSSLNLVEIFEPAETMSQLLLRVHAEETPDSIHLQLRKA